ncbi:MAG TPA: hypothetical protein VEV41_02150 [Terriglobales bacterium]|nr:hypothetical protein [Terriglobales bacterium]HYM08797.1 hypothetical protein [Terriglobales bacterium]HYM78143.1 hypothetical protein [Candidatus Dormibacteraeota bacterium]
MPSKFRLELVVTLDKDGEAKAIESARQHYIRGGRAAHRDDGGGPQLVPANEFIDGTEQALMELLELNPLLSEANVEITSLSCRSIEPSTWDVELGTSATPRPDTAVDHAETEDELDELESNLYLCRWPNGDFSIVKADGERAAVVQLDEWAGAEPAWLVPLETCMIDFRLNDQGGIELADLGEQTAEFIWDHCYPDLDQLLSSEDVLCRLAGAGKREVTKRIRRAVEHERKRLWGVQTESTPARTALGQELQKRLGTVGPVADHYVELAASEILRGKAGENGKPS